MNHGYTNCFLVPCGDGLSADTWRTLLSNSDKSNTEDLSEGLPGIVCDSKERSVSMTWKDIQQYLDEFIEGEQYGL